MGAKHVRLCGTCSGLCCRIPAHVSEDEAERLPAWLMDGTKLRRDDAGACVALDDANRCTIYQDRPEVCRRFEEGGAHCLLLREQIGEDR